MKSIWLFRDPWRLAAFVYYGFSGCAISSIIAALWIGLYIYLLYFRGVW
jgi:hypothetical protein